MSVLETEIGKAFQKLRTARFLVAIAERFAQYLPAKFDRVPFREVLADSVFSWRGRSYIKENEDYIFRRAIIPRPFPPDELVEISVSDDAGGGNESRGA